MATRTVPTASLLLVCPAVATTRPGPLVSAAGRPGQLLECSTRAGAGPGSGAADSAAGLVRPMPAEPRVADGRPRRLAEPPDQRVGEADGAGQAEGLEERHVAALQRAERGGDHEARELHRR